MNFPVFIFHVWDAAELFSVFPVQRGEDHSDKSRGGSVSLKNQAYPPALRQRHPSAPAFSVLHHKGRYAGTERKVPRHRSGIPPWKNPFSFCRCFLYGPIKRFRRHEFWQSDHGCPLKCFFMCIVNAIHALLMPQALQRWNHIFKIAVHLVATLIAHFDGESNAVQHSHSLLIGSTRSIRVALAVHCHKFIRGIVIRCGFFGGR